MVPLMMVMMFLILSAGVVVYWLGFSTSQSAQTQTAADAAALAAEKNVVDQLQAPVQAATGGAIVPSTPNWTEACEEADHYAELNDATVISCGPVPDNASTIGQDALVEVEAGRALPANAPDAGHAAKASAQASTDPYAQASPSIKSSTTYTCEASTVPGNVPTFNSHGGTDGFFPAGGTNYTFGCETRLAGALDKLATAKHLHLSGTSGYVAVTQANSSRPAAVAHGCGDASTTTGLASVPDSVLTAYGLVRPYPNHPDEVELNGISCQQQSTSTDASGTPAIGLGNLNVHLVPLGGGPQGSLFTLVGGGSSSIGETPLQVGCQIWRVWQHLPIPSQDDPRKVLLIALMAAQDESVMGQNIGVNRSDPTQSIGVFQQISNDGWGTIPEEMNVTTAAEMFFLGGHDGNGGTEGALTYYEADPGAPPWTIDQETQGSLPGEGNGGLANYGAQPNVNAAQSMFGQVTSGQCKGAAA